MDQAREATKPKQTRSTPSDDFRPADEPAPDAITPVLKEPPSGTDIKLVSQRGIRERKRGRRPRRPSGGREPAPRLAETAPSVADSDRRSRATVIEGELIKADARAPRHGCATVPAARHPDRNEDRVLCDAANGAAAVFDGIGGEAGGELAARAACGAMAINLARLPQREEVEARRRWLTAALKSGHDAIRLSRRLHQDSAGQGTTALAVVLAGDKVLTACIGDSRAYRIRGASLELIADEHADATSRPPMADALDRLTSLEELQGADNDLKWAFAHRNILSAALGDGVQATVREHEVASDDLILLASDGVHDNLTGDEIETVVGGCVADDPQVLATTLVAYAQRRSQDREHIRSKDDDITCAVLRVP